MLTRWKSLLFLALTAVLVSSSPKSPVTPEAHAQIAVNIGVAPVCPYGYFDYAPYDCAPYGYYSPDWFIGGVFIGAGPWFHGPRGFYGHVDNRWDPHNGYRGPLPGRGSAPFQHFTANEARDGRGNVGTAAHDGGREHSAGFSGGGRAGGGHGGRR
jgi:hypothetical protein